MDSKCFSCDGEIDVDEMGEVVCLSCGEHQNNIFELFDCHNQPQSDNSRCLSCSSKNLYNDSSNASVICVNCGTVQRDRLILDEADWNNYTSSREEGTDNSRVGWFDQTNPYSTLGSVIKSCKNSYYSVKNAEGKVVRRDLAKMNQIGYSRS